MAQLLAAFDATQHNPQQSAGSLPVGKHPVIIEASEVKANSANTGGFLELTLRVTDGPNAGESGPYRLNLYNQSQKAVEIAHSQLSAVCHVTGVFNVTDSSQLHNIPFVVEIGLQKDPEAQAKGYTEVKRVYDINGNEPGKQGQQQAAQPQQQQVAQQPIQQQQAAQQTPAWGQQQPAQQQGGVMSNQPPAWGAATAEQGGAQSKPAWAK